MSHASSKIRRSAGLLAVLASAALAFALTAGTPVQASSAAAPHLGAGRHRGHPPRHDDVHARAPSAPRTSSTPTARATSTSGTPPTAPASARPPTPTAARPTRCPLGTTVTFNEGGSLISEGTQVGAGTLVYSLLDHHEPARHHRRQHLRLQRPRPGQGRRRATSPRSTRASRSGAARPASTPTAPPPATGSTPTATPASAPASRRSRPHTGISLGDDAADGGWSHPLYTVTPGIPGDSGSAFLSADGKAIGTLSTLGLAPLPAVQQHRRPRQGARLRPGALRASPACSWSTAPSRSTRIL